MLAGIVVEMPKAQTVLNLAKDIKGNRKVFYRYTGNRRKAEESMGLLLNGASDKAHGKGQGALPPTLQEGMRNWEG